MNGHDAVALAEYIARDVRDRGKPPPSSNKDCRSYIGDNYYRVNVLFLKIGMLKGSCRRSKWCKRLSTTTTARTTRKKFDVLIAIPPDYPFPNSEGHICTTVELNNQTPITLKSAEFFTNETRKNWSSMLFLAPNDFSGQHGEHFDCDYSGKEDWDVLASWSPGKEPIEYGDGIVLEERTKIILKQLVSRKTNPLTDWLLIGDYKPLQNTRTSHKSSNMKSELSTSGRWFIYWKLRKKLLDWWWHGNYWWIRTFFHFE